MNGIKFFEELRSDPALRRMLVFMMTGSVSPSDWTRAYDMNVAGVIPKPVAAKSFLRRRPKY